MEWSKLKCPKCQKVKPARDYYQLQGKILTPCKECRLTYQKARYAKEKEEEEHARVKVSELKGGS